jgi:transposase
MPCYAPSTEGSRGKDRSYIKGQQYILLTNWETLTKDGRESLGKLLAAGKRLNTAYMLKE